MKRWMFICLAGVLVLSLSVAAAAAENPFTDVGQSEWYYKDVMYVYENGLMEGSGAFAFSPAEEATRAQLIMALWRLEGKPVVNYAMDYADVSADAWYAEAVRWAASQKLANGYGGGQFGPQDALTREQMVTILYRYVAMKGKSITAVGTDLRAYPDTAEISDFAKNAVAWAVGKGLLQGMNGGLAPKEIATRAQTAAMLQRLQEQVLNGDAGYYYPTNIPEGTLVSSLADVKEALKEGATVVDAQGANLGEFYYDIKFTDGMKVKNATFTYFYGGNVEGTVVFENCRFVSEHSYAANFDSGNGNIVFNNCLFDGWSSFGTAIKNVEMNNCIFLKSYKYGVLRFYQNAQLNGCIFRDSFDRVDTNMSGTEIHFNDCSGIEGKVFNNGSNVGKWFVDGEDISAQID